MHYLKYGLIAMSMIASGACVSKERATAPMPVTNSPGARPNSNSSTVDRADAFAQLAPTHGSTVTGRLRLTADDHDVRVVGTVTGLAPNSNHGIQMQQNGDCGAPEASIAADHLEPRAEHHGGAGLKRQPGDLGNLMANQAGVAYIDVLVPGATLGGIDPSNIGSDIGSDIAGRIIVVHTQDHDPKTQSSGDSSARLACGVIRLSASPPR